MLDLANSDKAVKIESDFYGNTATVYIGSAHTHVGVPDGSFDLYVEHLYNSLHGGPGLSFFDEAEDGN
jgi:hypothetical protein